MSRQIKHLTRHHVPPKHPAETTPEIVWKSQKHHDAYHLLFQNCGTREQVIQVLERNWGLLKFPAK